MLPQIVAVEIVFRHAMQWRRKIENGAAKSCIARRFRVFFSRQIDIKRLFVERRPQGLRKRCAAVLIEIGGAVPPL